MLDYEYIKQNTKWVVKFNAGRITCSEKEIDAYKDRDDVRDIDIVSWQGQPKELQAFYKAYEHATYDLGRKDLFLIEDFYNVWKMDPNQFDEEHRPVISTLSKELENLDVRSDLVVENYDSQVIGNHKVGNFVEALDEIFMDYNVIQVTEKYGYPAIIIQEDDQNKIELLQQKSNQVALRHDKYFGDGKYS